MARRRKKRRSRKFTLPLAPVLGLTAGLSEPAQWIATGNYKDAMDLATANYTGFEPYNTKLGWKGKFNPARLSMGLLPLVAGLLVHKFVGGAPLNLNRTLGRANVPFLRI